MTYQNTYSASTKEHEDMLEAMIDKHSAAYVLGLLADIMTMKGQHIRDNWQDVNNARAVELIGKRLTVAQQDVIKHSPSYMR